MSLIDDLKHVFDPAGIPQYVWEPIARQESGLNPASWNKDGEDSRGLFQINTSVHPEYAGLNLFDPVVNAKIALRDFIQPAYSQISWHPDPGVQAAYVWQFGIKPNWSSVTARGKDTEIMAQARTMAGGGQVGSPAPAAPGPSDGLKDVPAADKGIFTSGFWTNVGLWSLFAVVLLLLFGGGFWGLAKAFGVDDSIKQAAGAAAKVAAL